jgi:outer membrane biosynthesis protein TonB
MIGKRQLVIALLEALLLLGAACHKKQAAQKPKLPGPAEAPTVAQKLPEEIQPVPQPENPTEAANKQEPQPYPKKTRPRKKPQPNTTQAKGNTASPTVPPQQASSDTTTTASVRPPGNPADTAVLAIGPDVSSAEAVRDRQSTNQLLDTTERDLKRLDGRNLSSDEQTMLTQIRAYISQSRKALTDGDYERASNLAKKAQVLSDDLLKK